MTVLYRCRTSLSEIARTFGAIAPSTADWSAEVWPGRVGLVVHETGGDRRISALAWGVRGWSAKPGAGKARCTSAWFRELYRNHAALIEPERRCLVVLEAFAYPDGAAGARTRTWFGFEDRPIFAWAGFSIAERDRSGFCGFLAAANDCLAPSRIMPAIVAPQDYDDWLAGGLDSAARIARTTIGAEGMYREPTEEPWGGEWGGGHL